MLYTIGYKTKTSTKGGGIFLLEPTKNRWASKDWTFKGLSYTISLSKVVRCFKA